MIHIKSEFSDLERLLFGPLFAIFAALVAAMIVRHLHASGVAMIILAAAAVLIVIYYAVPGWQVTMFRGWIASVAPLGFLISGVLLALLYYGLVTPIGLVLRARGYDPLTRAWNDNADTYWVAHRGQRPSQDYFRQY